MIRTLQLGLVLSLAMGILAGAIWTRQAAIAALAFGLFAPAVQLIALRWILKARGAKLEQFMKAWVGGTALRFVSIGGLVLAAALLDEGFPPLAAALGFLGVMIPLLYVEVRLIR